MKLISLVQKILVIVTPIVVVMAAGWALRAESDFFIVREMPVQISNHPDQNALLKSLKPEFEKTVASLKGLNIWKLSLSKVRQDLLESPWIETVELSRRFPNKISAQIKLKEIPLVFVDSKNHFFPLSFKGEKLPQISANRVPLAPFLRNNKIVSKPKELATLMEIYKQIPAIGPLKKENIESVDFNNVSGLTLKLLSEDVEVHLGQVNIQTKALQILRVLDYLKSQKHKARVIDASFTKKVLVRLRKRS